MIVIKNTSCRVRRGVECRGSNMKVSILSIDICMR